MTANQVVVKLNVGGVRYETSLSNLIRYPESMLGRWFLDWIDPKEEKFIDFDGPTFSFVLEFLRHGPFMVLPKDAKTMDQLRLAADYFALDGLKEVLAAEFAGLVGSTLSEGALVKFSRFGVASLYESLLAYGFQSDELSGSVKGANLGFLYPAGDAWKCLCPGCHVASSGDRIWNEAIAAAGAIKREMLCNSMTQMKFAVIKDYGMCVCVKQGCFTFLKEELSARSSAGFCIGKSDITAEVMTASQVVVKLNVGGVRYETSLSNLIRYPESMLGRWFLDWNDSKEEKFIDFDGPTFSFVLEFLRHGPFMVLPENAKMLKQLRLAAEYFMLDDLKEFLAAEFAGLVGSTLAKGALVKFSRFGVASLYKSLLAYGFQSEELCKNSLDVNLGYLYSIGDAWKCLCLGCNVTSNKDRSWSDAMAAAGEIEREMLSNSMSQMKFTVVKDYGMCVCAKQVDLDVEHKFHVAKTFLTHV